MVARYFSPFKPTDIFRCQTPSKNAKFDLFGSEKCQLANLVSNRDCLILTVVQAMGCKIRSMAVWVNTWNSLPNWVVSANTTNMFKTTLDKFWHSQDLRVQLQIFGSHSKFS